MENIMDTRDLINFSDAAKLAGVSRQTLYKWLRQGKIRPIAISGGRLIDRNDILKLKLERELNG
jgi:excisionase family DNA binding protein